jgi:lysyl-tRNA synthetase class 2
VRQALEEQLGLHVDDSFSHEILKAENARLGLEVPESIAENRGDLLSFLIDMAQRQLGQDAPIFLVDWPAFMTASAAKKPGRPELTDRSELVIRGLEISDGFPWIGDGPKQAAHFEEALGHRRAMGKPEVRLDSKYLAALGQGMPPGAGMALGIDRLMMTLLAADDIRDVSAFVWDEV